MLLIAINHELTHDNHAINRGKKKRLTALIYIYMYMYMYMYMYIYIYIYIQCWGKLLLKVMHYNIALLPKKVTNYVT